MKYYLIAPLKLNLPPLEYESCETFHKNDIVKISVKNKSLLGIVLSEVEKPNFKCKEAVKSEFALSESQVILGHFVANYYCTNLSVAFGIFTLGNLGNSSLGAPFALGENFGEQQTTSLVLSPKFSPNTKLPPQILELDSKADSAESKNGESANPPQQTIEGIAVEVAEFLPNFECETRLGVCEHSKFGKSMQDAPKSKLNAQDESATQKDTKC